MYGSHGIIITDCSPLERNISVSLSALILSSTFDFYYLAYSQGAHDSGLKMLSACSVMLSSHIVSLRFCRFTKNPFRSVIHPFAAFFPLTILASAFCASLLLISWVVDDI